jgi:hypothetical protein
MHESLQKQYIIAGQGRSLARGNRVGSR